jgi:hypothetical protein
MRDKAALVLFVVVVACMLGLMLTSTYIQMNMWKF